MLTDDTILTSGKYKFVKLCRVPADFLLKYLTNGDKAPATVALREYAERNKEKLIMRRDGLIETPVLEVEIPCTKFLYYTENQAKAHLNKIRNSEVTHKIPCRAYECGQCGGWHLTSMSLAAWQTKQKEIKKSLPD